MKRKGDKGSPCLRPLVALNVVVGAPFNRIEKFGVEIMLRTQFTHLSQNPKALRIVSRYFQLSLSYAFERSSLISMPFYFFVFSMWITS